MKSLYDQSVSCVRANGLQSEWFEITSGVRQGCVIAPDSFATDMDWVMDRAGGKGMNGVVFGQDAYTDLDADDISSGTNCLVVPLFRLSTVGSRAFPVATAKIWNALPDSLVSVTSPSSFRHHLKTFLF